MRLIVKSSPSVYKRLMQGFNSVSSKNSLFYVSRHAVVLMAKLQKVLLQEFTIQAFQQIMAKNAFELAWLDFTGFNRLVIRTLSYGLIYSWCSSERLSLSILFLACIVTVVYKAGIWVAVYYVRSEFRLVHSVKS